MLNSNHLRFIQFQSSDTKNTEFISHAIAILGELLSRGSTLGATYSADEIEAAPLAAILEVKVSKITFK